jgi:protein-disulfide isomerase
MVSHECRKCQRSFPTREAYEKHVRKVHAGRAPWGTGKLVAAGLALLIVAGGVAALAWKSSQPAGPVNIEAQFSLSDSPRQGSDSAPVKLFAFESPQCSSCRFFHVGDGSGPSTYDLIVQNFVDTGKVQYVEKTFYVGYPWERTGAAAQKCVWHTAPEKFHLLTTAFYESQDRISKANVVSFVEQWATSQGLDGAQMRACVEEDRYTSEADADVLEGRRAGARGTPTFIVVGPTGEAQIITGPQSYHTFQVAFEDALVQ